MTINKNIGVRIKQKRKERKLSQADVGWWLVPDATKASAESKIKRFEVNGQEPTIEELTILAVKMDCSLKWLMTGEDKGEVVPEKANELLVLLVKEQSKRMDEMQILVNRVMDVVSTYKNEVDKVWEVINTKDASLATVNESIREITVRLLDIREDMNRAAENKDISLLKKVAGD